MIVLFVGLALPYAVGGALFQKYRRGAEGKAVIPHVEFWRSLPGLVVDGIRFSVSTLSGGRIGSAVAGKYDSL